jgi:hypothetical protein
MICVAVPNTRWCGTAIASAGRRLCAGARVWRSAGTWTYCGSVECERRESSTGVPGRSMSRRSWGVGADRVRWHRAWREGGRAAWRFRACRASPQARRCATTRGGGGSAGRAARQRVPDGHVDPGPGGRGDRASHRGAVFAGADLDDPAAAAGLEPTASARRAVERDEEAIAAWVKHDWPRTKGGRRRGASPRGEGHPGRPAATRRC